MLNSNRKGEIILLLSFIPSALDRQDIPRQLVNNETCPWPEQTGFQDSEDSEKFYVSSLDQGMALLG